MLVNISMCRFDDYRRKSDLNVNLSENGIITGTHQNWPPFAITEVLVHDQNIGDVGLQLRELSKSTYDTCSKLSV